jgi:heptaprenyl diphosphate synthase
MEETSDILHIETRMHSRREEAADAVVLAEAKIRASIEPSSGLIREMCLHIANSGGKRLRPQLVLHSGMAISRLNERMLSASAAAELIHMASLAHDDVIDGAALRRGRPSANRLWGNHAAVLCGDWLFAAAFSILGGRGLSRCMGWMVEAIREMCQGEILQAGNTGNLGMDEAAYLELIAKKTAKLTQACCMCGAAAGGAGEDGIAALGGYGLNIGLAFQIIDDVLDFRGKPGVMGKPAGEDLRRGIITLPVILLLGNKKYGGSAGELLLKGNCTAVDLKTMKGILAESGALDEAGRIAGSYIAKALECLGPLPESESKRYLLGLAEGLRGRKK